MRQGKLARSAHTAKQINHEGQVLYLPGILWIPGMVRQGHEFQLNRSNLGNQTEIISGCLTEMKK